MEIFGLDFMFSMGKVAQPAGPKIKFNFMNFHK